MSLFELKPCPFCGETPRLVVNEGVSVICPQCHSQSRTMVDYINGDSNAVETVVASWNSRFSDVECPGVKTDK